MNDTRLQEILTALRAASDPLYRNDLIDKALIETARAQREIYAARAAAVRLLAKGGDCDIDTIRTIKAWRDNQ